jgi:hypothetical protein
MIEYLEPEGEPVDARTLVERALAGLRFAQP